MARLIDADAMLEYLNLMYDKQNDSNEPFNCAVVGAINYIKHKAPTIDAVSVVRGEWIDMGDFEQCSACKGTRLKEFQTYYGKATWIKTDFCPNCGAKMDGERKESE